MIPCSLHASLVCKDSFSQINLFSVSYYNPALLDMTMYYWYCSLDMHDGAIGPMLVPWALKNCQAFYEDAKGLIMVATMV